MTEICRAMSQITARRSAILLLLHSLESWQVSITFPLLISPSPVPQNPDAAPRPHIDCLSVC